MSNIIIFNKACLFDSINNETIIYGQYKQRFNNIKIDGLSFSLHFCNSRPDFYIKIKGKHLKDIDSIIFDYNTHYIEIKHISVSFPFDNCDISLNSNSAIISTMCKDYGFRLDEWIKYNLKLGFSGIIIFNNEIIHI